MKGVGHRRVTPTRTHLVRRVGARNPRWVLPLVVSGNPLCPNVLNHTMYCYLCTIPHTTPSKGSSILKGGFAVI